MDLKVYLFKFNIKLAFGSGSGAWYGRPKLKRPKSLKAETIRPKNSKGRKIRPNIKIIKAEFS